MRLQKPKDQYKRVYNRFSYYLEDIDCQFCKNWRGQKRGCRLYKCGFDNEKLDAIKHGRIKRKRGELQLGM